MFGDISYNVTHASAGSHKTHVTFSNGLSVEFQDNPKQGNINIKIIKLPNYLKQKWSGVLGEFYNSNSFRIEQLNHSTAILNFKGQLFQLLKRDHLRNKVCSLVYSRFII